MNQVTNLTQWKNIPERLRIRFDFKNYKYQCQVNQEWFCIKRDYSPIANEVYRLVIEPDKWYWIESPFHDEAFLGSDVLKSAQNFEVLRPAKESENPVAKEKTFEESYELHLEKLTGYGQIKEGDKLLMKCSDGKILFKTAKEVLFPKSDKEEVIYNKKKNYYFITAKKISENPTGYVRVVYRVLFSKGEL